jgi:hypothetical protein
VCAKRLTWRANAAQFQHASSRKRARTAGQTAEVPWIWLRCRQASDFAGGVCESSSAWIGIDAGGGNQERSRAGLTNTTLVKHSPLMALLPSRTRGSWSSSPTPSASAPRAVRMGAFPHTAYVGRLIDRLIDQPKCSSKHKRSALRARTVAARTPRPDAHRQSRFSAR